MSIGKRTKASHLHEALAGGETSIIQRNIVAIQIQFEVNQQKRLSKIWTSSNDDLEFINKEIPPLSCVMFEKQKI